MKTIVIGIVAVIVMAALAGWFSKTAEAQTTTIIGHPDGTETACYTDEDTGYTFCE